MQYDGKMNELSAVLGIPEKKRRRGHYMFGFENQTIQLLDRGAGAGNLSAIVARRPWAMTEKFCCQNCGKEITQQQYVENDGLCDDCKEDKEFEEEQDEMDEDEDFGIAPHY